jgi:hypothetical protein
VRDNNLPHLFRGGYKVIADLNNGNDNKSHHRWSEQEIHNASFPRVKYAKKLKSYSLVA